MSLQSVDNNTSRSGHPGQYRCNGCHKYRPASQFKAITKGGHMRCEACRAERREKDAAKKHGAPPPPKAAPVHTAIHAPPVALSSGGHQSGGFIHQAPGGAPALGSGPPVYLGQFASQQPVHQHQPRQQPPPPRYADQHQLPQHQPFHQQPPQGQQPQHTQQAHDVQQPRRPSQLQSQQADEDEEVPVPGTLLQIKFESDDDSDYPDPSSMYYGGPM